MRFRLASSSSLLLAAALLAQDPGAGLVVPAGAPPAIDGDLQEEEWSDALVLDVKRVEDVLATARLKSAGRQLYVAFESGLTPWGMGVRLNFMDPVSKRTNPVLVTPLDPPRSPLLAFRQPSDQESERVPTVTADLRLRFERGFSFELRLPMDLVELPRSDRPVLFGVEVWDLASNRTVAIFPAEPTGAGALGYVELKPATTWGAEEPLDAPPPPDHPALALLEEVRDEGLDVHTGRPDGKRDDEPLANVEERLASLIERYPDYISLRALLVQIRAARNDLGGALEALDALGAAFPEMGTSPPHLVIRMGLLRDLGRYEEALALLDEHPEFARHDPRAAVLRLELEGFAAAWELEQRMREADAERGDLPRVELKTSKGDIVLELFEDDAPNGVANFVALAEAGFYDGTRFHWVEGGRRVIGGDPNSRDEDPHNDGFGDPGYLIESNPGRRLNFPYMVAFSDKRRVRRSEGSSFVIHIAPLPLVDGLNTVFGRVVEGFDVVRALEYYDTVEKAEVLRKRPHEYVPVKRP